MYVPRFYGMEVYGEPDELRIDDGKKINVNFKGELRPKQKPVVEKFMKHIKKKHSGLLALHTGFGKCLNFGTPIMLSNGKIKMVENIKVGDKLMGDDSTPRTVLSLARGREMMYDIIPTKGDKYTVNESHILSLRCGYSNGNKNYIKDKIIDIELKDFLKLPKTIKNHLLKGYRVPINFPEKPVDLDPYVLGYWLGDGTSSYPQITTIDEPVVEYFKMYCEEQGLFLRQGLGRNNITYTMSSGKANRKGISGSSGKNPVLNMLKKHNLINNKHIPHIYKCNSKSVRLELLAGIIDSDGYYCNGCYEVIQKNETLLDDIIYIARSLGFAAYKKKCEKSCMYKGERKTGTYYRTHIHGEGIEYIPVKLERKKANKKKQIKNVLNTGIKVVKKEVDEYFGFEIDGNRRFVLGDFTVTHNTCLALNIISKIKLKTLIVVHKEFLLRQWVERIEQFLPDAKVGKIQAKTIDTEGKDIVICMLQSLSMKEYPKDMFKEYGFSIYDECFPYKTKIHTENGLINIGSLYEEWKNKEVLPKILSFNRITKKFEYKYMSFAWRKERKDLIKIKMSKRVINCTPEHKILTKNGYIEANKLKIGDLIISKYDKTHIDNIISPVLNEDYGYLKVTSVNYFENKGANRCNKPYVYDIEVQDNHNFVIGSDKEYIDGPVVSNCHHLGAEVFSKAFYKVVTKYSLGLSATINRKDGLTKVIKWFLGDVVCKLERKGEDNVLVKVINYETTDEEFNNVLLNFRGQVNYTGMIKKLCEFNRRSEFILRVLYDLLKDNPNQQIMILAHQKKLLQYLHDAIKHRTIATVGYYVGGMKEKDLKISEGKKVIIATYAMAEEGLDIKSLTSLIMATPKVDVRQSVGRILRQKHNQAVVVDIVDSHSIFQRHFTKRKTFYKKSKFKIIQTNMDGYQNGKWETIYDPVNNIKKAFSKTKNEDKLLQGVCLIEN